MSDSASASTSSGTGSGSMCALSVTNDDSGEVIYEIVGDVSNAGICMGMVIDKDGKMKVGGVKGKVTTRPAADLVPWPFAEGVVVKQR